MSDLKDVPGVLVFPPLIPLAVLIVGVFLDWLVPLSFLAPIPIAVRIAVGLGLIVTLGLPVESSVTTHSSASGPTPIPCSQC